MNVSFGDSLDCYLFRRAQSTGRGIILWEGGHGCIRKLAKLDPVSKLASRIAPWLLFQDPAQVNVPTSLKNGLQSIT